MVRASNFFEESAIIIGIGEYHIGTEPKATIGLGSCVAVILHDETRGIGAMAHVMLPESNGRSDRPGKYADSAVPLLFDGLCAKGSRPQNITAKLVGGASMFAFFGNNLNIGERNIKAIKEGLQVRKIRITGEVIGGNVGRSVMYNPSGHGKVNIKQADGTCQEV
ncbi:chemotaxis protein CheD [Methanosphaerula palustris]|uniref:Probable chemoreceptor glutamine deamidase CheD n=1 Tax=Methanosphaerula palustris (strain ATCC BAA-1556 / DSM 19958 / E1-9c) TaxID=521011 RepID=B8GK88_METPE|nr:chemotaxis protein CheD [Methanosphaerula palustris]ACL17159.1 CheD [Methanosphaerula palustris E1-9c]